MIKNFKWLLLVSLTFVACNDDEDIIVVVVEIIIDSFIWSLAKRDRYCILPSAWSKASSAFNRA